MFELLALRVLHYILSLSAFIRQWVFRIPGLAVYYLKGNKTSVLSDARTFKKLPLHIAFIFQEEDLSYSDIADTVLWSVSLGISYISLYDIHGVLKRNEKFFYDILTKRRKMDMEHIKCDIYLHSKLEKRDNCDYKSSSTIDVFLLSLEDGRRSLVNAAKTLSKQVCEKQLDPKDITPLHVDNYLQEQYKYPDPDLIVRFGTVESLLGFMPWQVRLTEILSLPTHKGLDYKTFKQVIVSYGATQQRFGT